MKRLEKALSLVAKMNEDELWQLSKAIRERYSFLESQKVLQFKVGDKVTFKGRFNETIKGKVVGLARKTVKVVDTDGVQWRISPSYLKKVKK